MSLSEKTVGLDELAAAIRRTPDYIRRNWLRMHREQGMPRKNPSGWFWSRKAIEAWIDGIAVTAAVRGPTVAQSLAANQNASLSRRYAGGRP